MTKSGIWPVILSGGTGSRLWPSSRAAYPKQFLDLDGGGPLFSQTVRRFAGRDGYARPVIVGSDDHRFLMAEELRRVGVKDFTILLEPEGRNTAPAIALAAVRIAEEDPGAVLLVTPSDHLIRDMEAFYEAIEVGLEAAGEGHLVTFGIVPDRAETGFGYIRGGKALLAKGRARLVVQFVEKPDLEKAEQYVAAGDYFWNSGIFLLPLEKLISELGSHAPDILEAAKKSIAARTTDLDFERPGRDEFLASPANSIDYAILEKTSAAAVVPVSMGWSDVGSWQALWEIGDKDDRGNTSWGDVIIENSDRCLVRAEGPGVALVGVSDMVVVTTKDQVLVSSRKEAQNVKKIVERLRAEDRAEHVFHTQVHRPWGSFEGTDAGDGFQVKRLIVTPGKKLSLQAHKHRAEHWIVVKGVATVTCDDQVFDLEANQSTYIPVGARHRLENKGSEPLHIIEVQSGSYLGEDDIIRFEDEFGRA